MKMTLRILSASILPAFLLLFPIHTLADASRPAPTQPVRRAAILPVSVHHFGQGFGTALKSPAGKRLQLELAGILGAQGVDVVNQNAVDEILVKRGVLKPLGGRAKTFQPEYEALHVQHMDLMTHDLLSKVAVRREETTPLTPDAVREIGQALGADTVFRAKIFRDDREIHWKEAPHEDLIAFLFLANGRPTPFYAQAPAYEKGLPPLPSSNSRYVIWVSAQNAQTGKILWEKQWASAYPNPKTTRRLQSGLASFLRKHRP